MANPIARIAGAMGEVGGRAAGRAAIEIVRQVSGSRVVRDAASGALGTVITAASAASAGAASAGAGALHNGHREPDMKLERSKAIDLARQMRAQYSERTVIDGEYHYVVWKDGEPLRAFPEVRGRLTSKLELGDFNMDLLRDPPPLR